MTNFLRIASASAVLAVAAISSGAHAQSSACYQTCTIEYNWPASQCANYCRQRSLERRSPMNTAPTRVYGYQQGQDERIGRSAGSCGTYRYWNGTDCADARNN